MAQKSFCDGRCHFSGLWIEAIVYMTQLVNICVNYRLYDVCVSAVTS